MHRTRNPLLVLVLALSGCEGEQAQPPPETAATAKRPVKTDPTADMVTAVSAAAARAPVELKFALGDRPQVGRPLDVEIAVLPVQEVDRLSARFHAGAGLELRHGAEMAAIQNPEPGSAISHKITIVPQRDGIFFVSAFVSVESPTLSITRTFSIPIIAGAGVPPVQGGSATPDEK